MKGKKTIIIFTDDNSRDIASALKERCKGNNLLQIIIISEKELYSFGKLFFENYFLKNDTKLKMAYNRRKEVKQEKLLDRLPSQNVSFDNRRAVYTRTYNVFLRYTPDVVVALTPAVINPILGAKSKIKKEIKTVVIADDFSLNLQMVHKEIDKYFVDNFDVRDKLVKQGIDNDKITVISMPVRNTFKEDIERGAALKSFDLPDKPTVLVSAAKYGDEKFKKVLSLIGEEKLDVNVIVACETNRKMLAYVREKTDFTGYNEGIDMNAAYCAADVVITRPDPSVIAEALFKKKLIFSIFAKGEAERRAHEYLGIDLVVKTDSAEDAVEKLKKFIEDRDCFSNIRRIADSKSDADSGKAILESLEKMINVPNA